MNVVLLDGTRELDAADVGGKAWSINRMAALGLPVPAAFCFPTSLSRETIAAGELPDHVARDIRTGVSWIERQVGRGLGLADSPLLVSVRSGAQRSMPGMMDTLLNVGINDVTSPALAAAFGRGWVTAAHRRLADLLDCDADVPDDPFEQIRLAVAQVCFSWMSPRAVAYRRHHGLTEEGGGTAVSVQAMVFGNRDARSGTGVLFTRNPMTGAKAAFGEWLPKAQGEELVGGTHDPLPLRELEISMPDAFHQLMGAAKVLESAARDVQDIEFTVDEGTLWLLQTRNAKRTSEAGLRIAVALSEERVISIHDALLQIDSDSVQRLLTRGAPGGELDAVVTGIPASGGMASGIVVNNTDDAEERAAAGEAVVLARETTDPADLPGILASVAVVTELGGATSHAAVVCRELDRVCVVGCGPGSLLPYLGQVITVDGDSGRIALGTHDPGRRDQSAPDPDLCTLARWLGTEIDTLAAAVSSYHATHACGAATTTGGHQR